MIHRVTCRLFSLAMAMTSAAVATWSTAQQATGPAPAKMFAAQTAAKQITLVWTRVERAVLYRIYEGPLVGGKFIGTINPSGDQFVRPVSAYGVTHEFAIEVVFDNGTVSPKTPFNPVIPQPPSPGIVAAPGRVRAAPAAGGALSVEWEPVPGATAYVISRQVAPGGFAVVCRVCPPESTYLDITTKPGLRHTYAVSAITPAGFSRPTRSNEVVAAGDPAAKPAPPATSAEPGPPKGTLRLSPVPGGCLAVGAEGNVIVRVGDGSVQLFERVQFGGKLRVPAEPQFRPVPGISNAVAVATSGRHSLVLIDDGTIRAWGEGGSAQLGNRSVPAFSEVPIAVHDITNAVAVAAGSEHSVALLSDGTIRIWGSGQRGIPGAGRDEISTNRRVPAIVPNISNVKAIAAGAMTSFALLADGSVRAWGNNWGGLSFFGVLGAGPSRIPHSATPLKVENVSNAVAITTSGASSLALLADGSVMAWGVARDPLRGEPENYLATARGMIVPGIRNAVALSPLMILLGDGTVRELRDPETPVAGIRDAVAVTSDFINRYALLADGRLVGWGLKRFWPKGMVTVAEFGVETARECSTRRSP